MPVAESSRHGLRRIACLCNPAVRAVSGSDSESIVHRHLHDPLGGICAGDQAEGRTDQAIVWRRVAGNIESIKGFSAQLDGLTFCDFKYLECREVNLAISWCALRTVARISKRIERFSAVSAGTVVDRVSIGIVRGAGGCRWICAEPILYRPVSDDHWPVVIGMCRKLVHEILLRGVHREWEAGIHDYAPGYLPASNRLIHCPVPVRSKLLSTAEGKLITPIAVERIACVLAGGSVFPMGVMDVLKK